MTCTVKRRTMTIFIIFFKYRLLFLIHPFQRPLVQPHRGGDFKKNTWLPGRPWVPGNMLRSNGGPYVIDHVTKLVAIGI